MLSVAGPDSQKLILLLVILGLMLLTWLNFKSCAKFYEDE
jgi:hypothetical protein